MNIAKMVQKCEVNYNELICLLNAIWFDNEIHIFGGPLYTVYLTYTELF